MCLNYFSERAGAGTPVAKHAHGRRPCTLQCIVGLQPHRPATCALWRPTHPTHPRQPPELHGTHAHKYPPCSGWASSSTIYNEILRTRPELVPVLAGTWYMDRKLEVGEQAARGMCVLVFACMDSYLPSSRPASSLGGPAPATESRAPLPPLNLP